MLGADMPSEALFSARIQLSPGMVALSFVRSREAQELEELLSEALRACSPVPVVVVGAGAREHPKTILSAGAQYAESADELIAPWQQARGAPNRTRAP
jgi:MerR family transcriptional regulator, light-induced transcriptional regulator